MGKIETRSGPDVSQLLREARSLIRDFHASRRRAGSHLKQDLARGRVQVRSEVKQMLGGFRSARKSNAAGPERARPPAAKSRGGGNGAGTRPKSKVPAVAQSANLGPKVLGTIDVHPEGITLAGVAARLGVAPVVLSKTLRGLVAAGKVRKEGRDYFPAAAGQVEP
jgi:hypothetical protein